MSKSVAPSPKLASKLTFKVREAAAILEVCEPVLRKMIRNHDLEAFKAGRSIRIPRRALAKLVGE